ncbi:MAG TPA: hypothetical protein VML54_09050 [Candidatus Limnocylindrales bacterium]|nr:hypothetical protein [Candidatus Limnocylindrales bacterium]
MTWDEDQPLARVPPDRHPAQATSITDEDGLFRFRAASWRRPWIWLEDGDGASALAEVGPGSEEPERAREIRLRAPGSLHGRVVDANGLPATDLAVELWTEIRKWLHPGDGVWFDDEERNIGRRADGDGGGFEVGLPSGVPFRIMLVRNGELLPRQREIVVLEPGEEREITLVLGGRARIVGWAVDSAGEPAADLDVWLVDPPGYLSYHLDGESPFAATRTDVDGRFAFHGVAAGRWWVGPAPRSEDRPAEVWAAPRIEVVDVAPEAARVELRLVVERGLYIRGRVIGPEGEPVPVAGVVARSGSKDRRGSVGGAGEFELGPVESGMWLVRAYGPDDGQLGESQEVEVVPGGEPVVLRLQPGGRLRGKVVRVRDGPTTEADVYIVLAGSSEWVTYPPTRFSPGTFERGGMPSGDYVVFARTSDGCFGELRVHLDPGEALDDLVVEVHPAALLRIRSTTAEHGSGWSVLRGTQVVSFGIAQDVVTTAVPIGPLVLEHWPCGLGWELKRARIELDLELGEEREIRLP